MKILTIYISVIFLLLGHNTFSQEKEDENIIPYVHGVIDDSPRKIYKEQTEYYGFQGYSITVSAFNKNIDKENIKSLKKKLNLKNIVREYNDTNNNRYIIESSSKINYPVEGDDMFMNKVLYVYPQKDKYILFENAAPRKPDREEAFIETYFNNLLEERITGISADSIDFAGRKIHLGNSCRWMGPHNVQCYNKGQISWNEYPTEEEAFEDIELHIKVNERYGLILSDTIIDVNFEFVPTKARRIVHKLRSRYGESTLIIYYIVQSVREGAYMSCVLSNYGVNKNDYYLAPLLGEVMDIPKVPENAYYIFDYPERDVLGKEEVGVMERQSPGNYMYLMPKLHASRPLGKLKNNYSTAIGAQLDFGVKTKNNFRFGLIFAVEFPVDRKPFIYHEKHLRFDTKANSIVNVGATFGYEKKLKENIYMDTFLIIGGGGLITNTKKDSSKSETEYYEVSSFMMSGGFGLRYKKVGCFAEYFYTPYPSSRVDNFGNSSIRAGVYLNFDKY